MTRKEVAGNCPYFRQSPAFFMNRSNLKKPILFTIIGAGLIGAITAACILLSAPDTGIPDDAAYRERSEIDFDTVTIFDEEVPLHSSVNNDNLAEKAELQGMARHILELVNQHRAAAGLQPLTWDNDLENCAGVRAYECSQRFAHIRPDGSQWYTVNQQIMHGENLAYGYKTADAAVTAWMNSPSHRFNILYPDFRRCSIAIYKNGNVLYYAQEFRL